MPLQNRVTPVGDIIATAARGTLMGNRGILHDDARQLVRTSRNTMWLICRLEFKGRRRELMSPGSYTELFFLDEAVALAAGHRPCGECRRAQYCAYMAAVSAGEATPVNGPRDLDRRLNVSRRAPDRQLASPTCLTVRSSRSTKPTIGWSPTGRCTDGLPRATPDPVPIIADETAPVVTPLLSITALRHGYSPEIHPSAR
ncbi:hypothetical protein [Mycolicibacterium sp. XJ1819]